MSLLAVAVSCRHGGGAEVVVQPGKKADTVVPAGEQHINVDSARKLITEKKRFEQALTDSLMSIGDETAGEQVTGSRYYVVAGSFSDRINAAEAAKKYKEGGYSAAVLPFTDKAGRKLQLVTVSMFTSRPEAESFLKKFRADRVPGAWLLEGN